MRFEWWLLHAQAELNLQGQLEQWPEGSAPPSILMRLASFSTDADPFRMCVYAVLAPLDLYRLRHSQALP